MGRFTSTPYLILFVILGAVGVGTASALMTITLAGNVHITGDADIDGTLTAAEIADGTILAADLADSGCADNEVLKWNDGAAQWFCEPDGSGHTFVRWGNPTATSGSTLLYSGFAMDTHYTQPAGTDTMCVTQNPEIFGSVGNENGALAYFGVTQTNPPHSTPIPTNKVIQCSVLFSQQPTFVLWGSSSCPSGWGSAYSGIVMSGHYTHSGGGGSRICVDNVSFDSSIAAPVNFQGALFYATEVEESTNGFTLNRELSCAVCIKNP
jgi:hypothetical protein